MLIKSINNLLFCILIFFPAKLKAQSLYEVADTEKVLMSTFIFEGEVVGQESFITEYGAILTINKIRVYKLYKGNIYSDTLLLLTQGGETEGLRMVASDLLQLEKGQYGLFFCNPNALGIRAPGRSEVLLDVYSSSQGFYHMDLLSGTASHPFKKFRTDNRDFENYLYNILKLKRPVMLHGAAEIQVFRKRNLARIRYLLKLAFCADVNIALEKEITILTVNPLTVHAGQTCNEAENLLTIKGGGFGKAEGVAAILFDNANDGNGGTPLEIFANDHLVSSWSDTLIQVRVPHNAGSGRVQVRNATGYLNSNDVLISVFYSISTATIQNSTRQANLISKNSSGGYTLHYSTNLSSPVQAAAKRAVNTWRNMAGLNFTEGNPFASRFHVADDGEHVIIMDNAVTGNPPLPAGAMAVCYQFYQVCSREPGIPYQKKGFDIVIRNPGFSSGSIAVESGPCMPGQGAVDLETVLLHSIGHAANLEHVNHPADSSMPGTASSRLMHYSISPGERRITPDYSAIQAVRSQVNVSVTTPGIVCEPMVAFITPMPEQAEAKDDCPLVFPAEPTFPGTNVNFDLSLAGSNEAQDPQPVNFNCVGSTGKNLTNTLFYPLRTNNAGSLEIMVSEFANADSAPGCAVSPGVELALYAVNNCPVGQNFPPPVTCRTITANGVLKPVTGLQSGTNYLLVADGINNSKIRFRLTFTGQVLPLKLKHFIGYINGPVNTLQWSLEAFSGVARVSLERSTENNQYVSVTSFDNSMLVANRTFIFDDANPNPEQNFYRLAIYNRDGSVDYAQVVLINRSDVIKISVRPNPVKDRMELQLSAAKSIGMVTLQILTVEGKKIYQQPVNLLLGQATYPVSLQIPSGTYFVSLINKKGQMLAAQPLIKE